MMVLYEQQQLLNPELLKHPKAQLTQDIIWMDRPVERKRPALRIGNLVYRRFTAGFKGLEGFGSTSRA